MREFLEISEHSDRIFAIGDIHGCKPELETMLEFLIQAEKLSNKDLVIFIGDYVDRGQDSKGTIELLLKFQSRFPGALFLRGNHEDMLLAFLGFPGREGMMYLANGGAECLESYGARADSAEAGSSVAQSFPPEHLKFLQSLQSYVVTPGWVFAHAGLNPLRDLRNQVEADLFWIRDEFILNRHFFGRPIVFGHTPYEDVMFNLPYKIGIDTGCVYGNKLSCVELKEGKVIQVAKGAGKVTTRAFPK